MIYKDFASSFRNLNSRPADACAVAVPGGRAYLREGKPYFDKIHLRPESEPWTAHKPIQRQLKKARHLHGRVYAGAAGEVNLNYIACSRAAGAVLTDINPLQTLFWQDLFDLIAACPERKDLARGLRGFAQGMYQKINLMHDVHSLKNKPRPLSIESPLPGEQHEFALGQLQAAQNAAAQMTGEMPDTLSYSDVPVSMLFQAAGEAMSPIRNMRYCDFAQWWQTRLGLDPEMTDFRDTKPDWLADKANYRHIHRLCKHGAISALTFDITDPASCKQLREALDRAHYTPVKISPGGSEIPDNARTGADIGLFYLSNVMFYIDRPEHAKARTGQSPDQSQEDEEPALYRDFTGGDVAPDAAGNVYAHLRFLCSRSARIIRFDHYRDADLRFHPAFDISDKTPRIPRVNDPGGLSPRRG